MLGWHASDEKLSRHSRQAPTSNLRQSLQQVRYFQHHIQRVEFSLLSQFSIRCFCLWRVPDWAHVLGTRAEVPRCETIRP